MTEMDKLLNVRIRFNAACLNKPYTFKHEVEIPIELLCIEKEKNGELSLTYYQVCEQCHESHRYELLRRKVKLDVPKNNG